MIIFEEFISGRDLGDEQPEFGSKHAKLIQREIDFALEEKDEYLFEVIKDQLNHPDLNQVEFDTVDSIKLEYNKEEQKLNIEINYKNV